jgi:hypothetical protein
MKKGESVFRECVSLNLPETKARYRCRDCVPGSVAYYRVVAMNSAEFEDGKGQIDRDTKVKDRF